MAINLQRVIRTTGTVNLAALFLAGSNERRRLAAIFKKNQTAII